MFCGNYKQNFEWQWLFYLSVDHPAPREQTLDYKIYYFAKKQNELFSVTFLYMHIQNSGHKYLISDYNLGIFSQCVNPVVMQTHIQTFI